MTKNDPIRALDLQHKELLRRVLLPDTLLHRDTPEPLQRLDIQRVRRLVGPRPAGTIEDAFAEPARLVAEVFLARDEGRRIHLTAETDLLQRVIASGEELLHRGPFGLQELVLPVKVRGHLVHLIRSGKFRSEPFSPADIQELAFATGIPVTVVQPAAAALPLVSGGALESWTALLRQQRDLLAAALESLLMAESSVDAESDRLTALGSMAEGMAHHFSNLLSVVLGYTSLVLAKEELSESAGESLRKVADAAQQARRFTEEVLTLAGHQDEEDAICSVHDRLGRALRLLQSRTGSRVAVETHFEAARDAVAASPGLVHQMVLNLLGHAFDALPGGGIVTIHTSNPPEGRLLRVEVATSSAVHRAGDSDVAEADRPALARLLGQVARMDGEVLDGVGRDHVVVTLPVADAVGAVIPEKRIRRRLAPSTIWAADDDPVVREMCRRVLVAEGHTVVEFTSGAAVQKRLKEVDATPDLILYDFSMPDRDGLELATWLRESARRVPVILVTGFTAEHPSLKKALQMRKVFLLPKPFSFRDMADSVSIAMGETLVDA